MNRKKLLILASLLIVLTMALGACATDTTTPPEDDVVVEEPADEVEEAAPEPFTLKVWTRNPCEMWRGLLDIYEGQNPHITVEDTCNSYDDLLTVWPAALQAGNPPDVGMIEGPYPGLPVWVEAGWFLELSDVIEERGWRDRYPTPENLDFWNTFYDGEYYTAPLVASLRGLYYNKDLMAQIGGTIPETVAELEALCDLAVAAEYTCMGLGNLGAWGSEGYWINLAYNNLALGDYAGFTRGIFEGEPGVPWGGEEVGKALETFVEWEQKGYFNEEYNAIAENDIPQEFLRGDMLLLWYWSEVNPTLTEANPEFAIGFFNFPQEYPDAPVLSLTGASSNWSIPIDAEHRDAGIEFMDFLLSAEAGQYLAGQGLMPILAADYSGVELPAPWVPEQLTALAEQTFMGWSNFSTPGLGGVTGPEVQKLLAGDTTIEEVLAAFQAAYEAGAAEIRGE